jgi:hypothetical protein
MNAASDRDEGFCRSLVGETTSRTSCGNTFASLDDGFFHTVRPMCPVKLEVQTTSIANIVADVITTPKRRRRRPTVET